MTEQSSTATANAPIAKKRPQPLILVVDDERRIAETLALILQSKGYATEVAFDGNEGIERYRASHPDLVISDVVMPRLNGIEMGIALRNDFPNCKIVLFSGQTVATNMLDLSRAAGHNFELLAKPLHPEVLLNKISTFLEEK